MAYTSDATDSACTYGGLVYGYSAEVVRMWRPTDVAGGGLVCVPETAGNGMHAQRSLAGNVVVHVWSRATRGNVILAHSLSLNIAKNSLDMNRFRVLFNKNAFNNFWWQ